MSLNFTGINISRIQQHDALRQFVDLANEFWDDDPALFARAMGPPVAALARGNFVKDSIDSELEHMRSEPLYLCPSVRTDRYVILESPEIELALQLIRPHRGTELASLAQHVVLATAGKTPVRIRRYWQSDPYPVAVLDPRKTLISKGEISLASGQTATFFAPSDVFQIVPQDETVLLLSLQMRRVERFLWKYDSATLAPAKLVTTGQEDQRLITALWLVQICGDRSVVPNLWSAFRHPAHNVRWATVQAMIRIDPHEARSMLLEATTDVHPDIRTTAAAVLPQFELALTEYDRKQSIAASP